MLPFYEDGGFYVVLPPLSPCLPFLVHSYGYLGLRFGHVSYLAEWMDVGKFDYPSYCMWILNFLAIYMFCFAEETFPYPIFSPGHDKTPALKPFANKVVSHMMDGLS